MKSSQGISNSKIISALIIIFAALALIWAFIFLFMGQSGTMAMKSAFVDVNGRKLTVEIAETDKQRYKGLSDREALCADCGMLFNFPDSSTRSFVMRDMRFPLDIIFIQDGVIKNIAGQLQPEGSEPKNVYQSIEPVNQVLEVSGGYCEKNDIKPGDKIWIR